MYLKATNISKVIVCQHDNVTYMQMFGYYKERYTYFKTVVNI